MEKRSGPVAAQVRAAPVEVIAPAHGMAAHLMQTWRSAQAAVPGQRFIRLVESQPHFHVVQQ